MEKNTISRSVVLDRIKGALFGAIIADSLAFPSHYFYGGPEQVKEKYGVITSYVDPVQNLPGSIMSKSGTTGGGRGSYSGNIIGDVIFHGKKKYWQPGTDYHYHNLLKAGESTLEITLMQRAMEVATKEGGSFDAEKTRNDYITFMTTEDSHNDTYCGACHKMFFGNLKVRKDLLAPHIFVAHGDGMEQSGIDPKECPDNDGQNVDTADSIVATIPIAFLAKEEERAKNEIGQMVAITRKSNSSQAFAQLFGSLMRSVAVTAPEGHEMLFLRQASLTVAEKLGIRLHTRRPTDPLTACYLNTAFPSVLQMVYKYSDPDIDRGSAFRNVVLANANRGGENVSTGALIGAMLGGACGFSNLPQDLVKGLKESEVIEQKVDEFLKVIKLS